MRNFFPFLLRQLLTGCSFQGSPKSPRPALGPARRPALRPAFNFFFKNNILYFYIYITNSSNKHKRNIAQLVKALKFKLEGRGSNPPLFLPLFKSHFGLFKKARGLARPARQPASPRAHRPGHGPPIYGPARPARWRPLARSTLQQSAIMQLILQ